MFRSPGRSRRNEAHSQIIEFSFYFSFPARCNRFFSFRFVLVIIYTSRRTRAPRPITTNDSLSCSVIIVINAYRQQEPPTRDLIKYGTTHNAAESPVLNSPEDVQLAHNKAVKGNRPFPFSLSTHFAGTPYSK